MECSQMLKCPWCGKGKVFTSVGGKGTLSCLCSNCKKPIYVNMAIGKTTKGRPIPHQTK